MSGLVTRRMVEDEVIAMIATDNGYDPDEFARDIRSRGDLLPIDSLLLVDVLVRVERRFGVHLPADDVSQAVLGSIAKFAARVASLAVDQAEHDRGA